MITRFLTLIIFALNVLIQGCQCCPSTKQDEVITIRGRVIRAGGQPVNGAPVVLMEEPSRLFDITPRPDRVCGSSRTGNNGEFAIVVRDLQVGHSWLVVPGMPDRVTKFTGELEVRGTDRILRPIAVSSTNLIVVPQDFSPLEQ